MPEAYYCERRDLGLLRVAGRDAQGFLHAQTTQAINDLPRSETRLAAWLSAKGRVRALFDVVATDEAFWLITEADNVAWLATELGRYVLRSDVRLDVVTDRAVWSCGGAGGEIELAAGRVVERAGACWLETRSSSILVFGKPDAVLPGLAGRPESDINAANLAAISVGRPALPASLRDRYTPHMLNLEQLGAISFKKGCYPGQEIVARTENLGTVKRRIHRFSATSGERPKPGDTIIDADDQSVGEVNRVAAAGAGYELLAVVPVESNAGELRLEQDGRRLQALPLPRKV
jgi:hypothetical protein